MELVSNAAAALTAIAALLCARAAVELYRGRDRAGRFAVLSMIAAAMFLPLIMLGGTLFGMSSAGPESKAFVLARSISTAFNCGALDIPIGAIAFVIWLVARRRARARAHEAGIVSR